MSRIRKRSEPVIEEIMRRRALGEPLSVLAREYHLVSSDAVKGLIRRRYSRFLDICNELGVDPRKFQRRKHDYKTIWTAEELSLLKRHYPTRMPLAEISRLTKHSYYVNERKAKELGLVRPSERRTRELQWGRIANNGAEKTQDKAILTKPENVFYFLEKNNLIISQSDKKGLYKINNGPENLTLHQIVRMANNIRLRRDPPLYPIIVETMLL